MGPIIIPWLGGISALASIVYRSESAHPGPPEIGTKKKGAELGRPSRYIRYAVCMSLVTVWQVRISLPGELVFRLPPPTKAGAVSALQSLTEATSNRGLTAGADCMEDVWACIAGAPAVSTAMNAPRAAVPANSRAAFIVKFDVTPLRFFIITSILFQPLDSAADRHTSGAQFEYSRHWTPKLSRRFPRRAMARCQTLSLFSCCGSRHFAPVLSKILREVYGSLH